MVSDINDAKPDEISINYERQRKLSSILFQEDSVCSFDFKLNSIFI